MEEAAIEDIVEMRSISRVFEELSDDRKTVAGVSLSPETALQCSAVLACVRVISESVATLPFNLFRRIATGGKAPKSNETRTYSTYITPDRPTLTRPLQSRGAGIDRPFRVWAMAYARLLRTLERQNSGPMSGPDRRDTRLARPVPDPVAAPGASPSFRTGRVSGTVHSTVRLTLKGAA
jgi:hypothetical protein